MLLIHNIGTLLSCEPGSADSLGVIPDAAIIAADDLVSWYGPERQMPAVPLGTQVIDARRRCALPGLVDSHTHLIHVGDRSGEFAARARGQSYQQIAAAGGGILGTVAAVRAASEEELVETAVPRLGQALARGVTTVEIKSGYGLDLASELKMLQVARLLGALQPIEIVPTFLGAHTLPAEHRARPERYVDLIVQEMIPQVADRGLARFCDVFVEEGAFDIEQASRVLIAAADAGMDLKIHADQFNSLGACQLAADLQAVSADHLEASTAADIEALASADVVATLLPLCEVYLGKGRPAPGRNLLRAGVRVAVASDFNPGSANCNDLCLAATLAVTRCGLSVEEAILGITRHAASALGRDDLGRLHVGSACDVVLLDTPEPLRLIADMGHNHVDRVIKSGRLVYARGESDRGAGART